MLFTPSIFRNTFADNVFDDFFNDQFWTPASGTPYNTMNTDIKETDGGYQIEMELPGFAKEDVSAQLKDGYLTVTATHSENKDEKDDKNEKYIRRERYSGHYQRSFYVGDEITDTDIKASFKDGILTVAIPKKEPKKPEVEDAKFISIEG